MRPVEISMGIVFRTILLILAIWFLYLIRDVLALLFIAVVIVAAMEPAVDWLNKRKVPRSVGVLLLYFLLLIFIGSSIYFLIPPIEQQFADFSQSLPAYGEKVGSTFQGIRSFLEERNISLDLQNILGNVSQEISGASGNIFSTTIGVFSGLLSSVVVLSLAFYMSAKEDAVGKFVGSITPTKYKDYAISLAERIKDKIGKWMQGQLLLMFIVFLLAFIGLFIIGIPYALVLAVFAGIMEIIPYVGPIVAAVPAVILGFLISPVTGLLVIGMYIIIQQFENHIIVPQIMKKAVGLNPIAVILALLIGAKLGGTLGAILAVPVATAISIFVGDILNKKNS